MKKLKKGCLLCFFLFHLLDEHLYRSWWHWYGGSCHASAVLGSFYRFFHFSSLLKAFITHVYFCAVLFLRPSKVISFLLPCCPWLFNRCVFLRPVFVFLHFFSILSFSLPYFLPCGLISCFLTLLRQPGSQTLPYRIAPLSPRGIFNRIFRATHQ